MEESNGTDYLTRTKNGTSFGGQDVNIFHATALACGLRLYAKTGMKPNRHYTPTNMLLMAKSFTGKTYKRNSVGYEAAATDLLAYADEIKRRSPSAWN